MNENQNEETPSAANFGTGACAGSVYFCPACHKGFNDPKAYLTPCCGAGEVDSICSECGNEVDDDYIIPQCPHCGNAGSDGVNLQPDFWEVYVPNDTGESRAIARTLDPIVGNLDSEVTHG